MGIYDKQQQLLDSVCKDIASFRTLIAPKDESKRSEFGFVPGMNNMQNVVNVLDEYLRNLHEGIFQVVFIGGFASGKSTLLNALMRKELLPSSIRPAGSVLTQIVFNAEEEKAILHRLDKEGRRTTQEHTIADVFDWHYGDREISGKIGDVEYVLLRLTQDGIGGSLVQLVDIPCIFNIERETVTVRKFAAKASAVVYLINAVMPFRDEDKQYIREHYAGQGLKNLFFVINRYDSVQPAQQDALKQNVRNQLHDVFTVDGRFEQELFESRVFYTNAYGSLNARLGRKTPTLFGSFLLDDDATGVPGFEKALGEFLTADDRDKRALAVYVPKLSAIYTLAKAKTAEEIGHFEQYAAEKADLERKRDKLNAAADRAEQILSGIQYACQIFADEVVRDSQRVYDEYVELIEREWDEHFSDDEVLKDIKFGYSDSWKIVITKDEAKKKELVKPLREAVEAFLKSWLVVLQRKLERSVQVAEAKFENRCQYYLQQLKTLDCHVDVDEILHEILYKMHYGSFDHVVYAYICRPEPGIFQKIIDICFDITVLERWFPWPVLQSRIDGVKDLLLRRKGSVISGLRGAKASLAAETERTVGDTILRVGKEFSDDYRREFAGYRESLTQVISDLDSATFSLSDEEERAKRRLEKMVEIISHISQLTTGKVLTESDVLARAASKQQERERMQAGI